MNRIDPSICPSVCPLMDHCFTSCFFPCQSPNFWHWTCLQTTRGFLEKPSGSQTRRFQLPKVMTPGGNIPLNPYDIPMIVDDCWYVCIYILLDIHNNIYPIYISHFVFHFYPPYAIYKWTLFLGESLRFGQGLRSRWRSPCEACAGDQAEAEQHRVFWPGISWDSCAPIEKMILQCIVQFMMLSWY